jgi:hypothetical protein
MGRTACTEPQCRYKGALYLPLPLSLFWLVEVTYESNKNVLISRYRCCCHGDWCWSRQRYLDPYHLSSLTGIWLDRRLQPIQERQLYCFGPRERSTTCCRATERWLCGSSQHDGLSDPGIAVITEDCESGHLATLSAIKFISLVAFNLSIFVL